MSSILVERAEEDGYTAVSNHVGSLLNQGEAQSTELADTPGSRFAADCVTLIGENRLTDLLSRLLSKADVIFNKAQDKDLECCIHVICHLAASATDAPAAAQSVAQALTAKTESRPEARLQGLSHLFNVVTGPALQHCVLLELLGYSKASGQAHALVPVIRANMESWPSDLALSPQQTRTLYQLAVDVLRSSKRKQKAAQRDAYKLTLKMLEGLEGAEAGEVAQFRGAAAAAAADFVKSPDAFQFDLADTPALRQLQGDAQHGPLFELLLLLLSGNVQEFEAFAGKNEGVFEAAGTSRGEALTKMRLMALLGLGAHPHPVPFADVQAALQVEEGEVEGWIVRAVGRKLLDARMDQTAATVTVTRCSHRSFGEPQWEELRDRLASWKANISSVRSLILEQAASNNGNLPPMPQTIRA